MKEEFYTQKRWLNWMKKVKDSNFKLTESDDKNSGAVFIYIMDDVVLACLKVIARFEREIISAEEALKDDWFILHARRSSSLSDGASPKPSKTIDPTGVKKTIYEFIFSYLLAVRFISRVHTEDCFKTFRI